MSPGIHGITSEHLRYASNRLTVLLSLPFSAILHHSHVPLALTKMLLIPLVKDRSGDLTSKDNYRPIALATILSKDAYWMEF